MPKKTERPSQESVVVPSSCEVGTRELGKDRTSTPEYNVVTEIGDADSGKMKKVDMCEATMRLDKKKSQIASLVDAKDNTAKLEEDSAVGARPMKMSKALLGGYLEHRRSNQKKLAR